MPLTVETAAALIPGAAVPSNTQCVRVVRPFMLAAGQVAQSGEVIALEAFFARQMIEAGKAAPASEQAPPEQPPPEKPAAKRQPQGEKRHAQ